MEAESRTVVATGQEEGEMRSCCSVAQGEAVLETCRTPTCITDTTVLPTHTFVKRVDFKLCAFYHTHTHTRVLYFGVWIPHSSLFREERWGFCPKVDTNLPEFCTWAWGTQLTRLSRWQTFNAFLFSGPLTSLHLLCLPEIPGEGVPKGSSAPTSVFCPSKPEWNVFLLFLFALLYCYYQGVLETRRPKHMCILSSPSWIWNPLCFLIFTRW